MEKRKLGRTGEKLSIIGFGGIVVTNETPETAADHVAKAIDLGINYFDVAPSYGNAQERLGPALQPYRDHVFFACKTHNRDAAGAASELEESLRLLRTDHVDLYQFHGVAKMEDAEQILAPGGAMETFLKARDAGKIRYIGFSAHSEEAGCYLLDNFTFDSVLYPVNFSCWQQGEFGPELMAKAVEKGTGILALKSLASRPWNEGEEKKWNKCWYKPLEEPSEIEQALHFTLSKPVTDAVAPGHAELLWQACAAVERISPIKQGRDVFIDDSKPIFKSVK